MPSLPCPRPVHRHRLGRLVACIVAAGAVPSALSTAARGDSLAVRSGASGGIIQITGKVNDVVGNTVSITTDSGRETSRELSQVVQMQLDDEPAFNAAETDYSGGKFDPAVDEYAKAIAATNKPWLKDWCNVRLADAAAKTGRFDAATDAYIGLVMKDPAIAASHKPTFPAEGSTYLEGAANAVNKAINAPGVKVEQQQILLGFLVDIQRARKDDAGVTAAAERLQRLAGEAPSGAGTTDNAQVASAIADARLAVAKAAVEQKNYDQALQTIAQNKALFTRPAQQADALWVIARGKDGLAEGKDDPTTLKDVALAYMRVVANFKDVAGAPHVADALLRTAAIQEKLGEPQAAADTYAAVAAQFKGSPQAEQAQKEVDRLKTTATPQKK